MEINRNWMMGKLKPVEAPSIFDGKNPSFSGSDVPLFPQQNQRGITDG